MRRGPAGVASQAVAELLELLRGQRLRGALVEGPQVPGVVLEELQGLRLVVQLEQPAQGERGGRRPQNPKTTGCSPKRSPHAAPGAVWGHRDILGPGSLLGSRAILGLVPFWGLQPFWGPAPFWGLEPFGDLVPFLGAQSHFRAWFPFGDPAPFWGPGPFWGLELFCALVPFWGPGPF